MVKTGGFKKIAALAATIAMLGAFAVSASALPRVITTTKYVSVDGEQKVNVVATVGELGGAVEVTYYAKNGSSVVYVDQTTANASGVAEFDYVTATNNLTSSVSVNVGYEGNEGSALPGNVPYYTISGNGITTLAVPTEDINGLHVLEYALTNEYEVTDVTANAPAIVEDFFYEDGSLSVTLSGATGNVTLTVTTAEKPPAEPVAQHIDSAGIVSNGHTDNYTDDVPLEQVNSKEGDRKVSVLGKLLNVGEDYGVIVSKNRVEAATNLAEAPADAYRAKTKNNDGLFVVQLIDNEENGTWLEKGATYYTGLYYRNPTTNQYVVVCGEEITIQ